MRKACPLADDGDQDVNRDRHPYLDSDGVLGGAIESFDAEMLLEPFEEQFYLPPGLVETGDGKGGQEKIVGDENEVLPCLRIAIPDPAKGVWLMTMRN